MRAGNRSTREKKPLGADWATNKLNPYMASSPESNLGQILMLKTKRKNGFHFHHRKAPSQVGSKSSYYRIMRC